MGFRVRVQGEGWVRVEVRVRVRLTSVQLPVLLQPRKLRWRTSAQSGACRVRGRV